jgi:hypothetical protein
MPLGKQGFQKGRKKTGGRRPGVQNHATKRLKDELLEALETAGGGAAYFHRLSITNPAVFCSLLGKLLPQELKVETEDGMAVLFVHDYTSRGQMAQVLEGANGFSREPAIEIEARTAADVPE